MRRTSRAAFTLVEMLVAMAVTLVMMGAVVTLFGNIGNSISGSRATMEISERVRNARNVLQRDLGNVTVTMIPSRRPEMDEGYFEFIEGPERDVTSLLVSYPPPNPVPSGYGLRGDGDDILMFTAHSRAEPYAGIVDGASVQSPTAEIIYYTKLDPNSPLIIVSATEQYRLRTLYRRVLLVNPGLTVPTTSSTRQEFHDLHDLSVRFDGTDFFANTLGDLTRRGCRYGRDTSVAFPFPVVLPDVAGSQVLPFTQSGGRFGDDVILANVLAFDVRAYDPGAPVNTVNGAAVGPCDPGNLPTTPETFGANVDLGYIYDPSSVSSMTPPTPRFNNLSFNNTGSGLTAPPYVYDTWSLDVEAHGTGVDGLDNDGNGIVDDAAERQFAPPFASPLRGIQVKIRVYEPDSRQVREVTVVQDFLPQ